MFSKKSFLYNSTINSFVSFEAPAEVYEMVDFKQFSSDLTKVIIVADDVTMKTVLHTDNVLGIFEKSDFNNVLGLSAE